MDKFDAAWGTSSQRRSFATFSGGAGEYFRIWIVNTLLTIVTLGIWLAWAKVRKRRYFYWNTYLDGHRFDYLAEPKAIFIGHLFVGGAVLAANLTGKISPLVGGIATLALYAAVPWLVYKAHRFKARYSAYRGIRFRFLGNVKEAYKVYAALPGAFLAAGAALGLYANYAGDESNPIILFGAGVPLALAAVALYPYWVFLRKRYTFSNFAYGRALSVFDPDFKSFYKLYLKASFVFLAAFACFALLAGVVGVLTALVGGEASQLLPFALVALYFLVLFTLDQYLYALVTNFCWNNLKVGPLSFEVDLNPYRLVWIRFTNIIAMLASFGLLTPWAEVRWYDYVASRFSVINADAVDELLAASDTDVAAMGDAAADFFDLEVGW